MLKHTVPVDDKTHLSVASSKSGAGGMSLTVTEAQGDGRASVYIAGREQALHLLEALIDGTRHMDWLTEKQAHDMVGIMRPRPWWRRWMG